MVQSFQKGHTPWNKGKKLPQITGEKHPMWGKHYSAEIRKTMGRRKGYSLPEEHKRKISEAMKGKYLGKNNWNWKGDNIGYGGLHRWVERELGKPDTCEHCEKSGLSGQNIHWANKDHSYKRKLEDWLRLCVFCHKQYDKCLLK